MNVSAASTDSVTANTIGVSAGVGAGSVNYAQTTIAPTVEAYIGADSKVTTTGSVAIGAIETPSGSATSTGVAIGEGAGLGVSLAQADNAANVSAYLGDGSQISAADQNGTRAFTIIAQQFPAANSPSAYADAIAGAGGLLLGADGASAEASSGGEVQAYTGSGDQLPDGDISVSAINRTDQSATSTGVAVGFIGVGAAIASASSNVDTVATLGPGTSLNTTGTLQVIAAGVDQNAAAGTAGSGGVIAGDGASGTTSDTSSVAANLEGGTISAASVVVTASHESEYEPSANSVNAAAIGASGATATDNDSPTVAVMIGASGTSPAPTHLTILGTLTVSAQNQFDELSGGGATAGAGGAINGSAALSQATLSGQATVTFGNNIDVQTGTDPATNPGGISVIASSILNSSDQVTLTTGGALEGAGVNSSLSATLTNNVVIGSEDNFTSYGNIGLGTYTLVDAQNSSEVSTYGLAGVGVALATTDVTTNQYVTVDPNTDMTAFGNVDLTPGNAPDNSETTTVTGRSSAQGYVRGLIAVPSATSTTNLNSNAALAIGAGDQIGSGQNIVIGGFPGVPAPSADGTGHGYELGFIPVTDGSSPSNETTSSTVTNDGTLTAGIYHDLNITIPNDQNNGFTSTITNNVQLSLTGTLASGSNLVNNLSSTFGLSIGQTVTGTGIPTGTTISEFGSSTALTGTLAVGSAVVTGLSSTDGLSVGEAVTGPGVPFGTTISSIDSGTQVTLSAAATSVGSQILTFLPYVVLSQAATQSGAETVTFGIASGGAPFSYSYDSSFSPTNLISQYFNSNTQTGTLTTGSTAVTGLSSTSGLTAGEGVQGTGIQSGTTISQINSGTSLAGTLTSGSTSVAGLSSTTGLAVGQEVTGTGIPGGTTITAINSTTTSITGNLTSGSPIVTGLSSTTGLGPGEPVTASGIPTGTTISQVNSGATLTGTLTSGSTAVTGLSSTSGLTAGQSITGTGIQPGTTISQVSSSVTETGTLTSGSTIVNGLPITNGLLVGQKVTGTGIPSGTTISHSSATASLTESGAITNGSATVTGLSSTAGLAVGQAVTGTGITADTSILSIDSSSQVTLNQNATATGSETLTFLPELIITGSLTGGLATVGMTSTTGLAVGQAVVGAGLPAGSTISQINSATTLTGTLTSGQFTVGVSSTTGLVLGQFVQGTGIPAAATISQISSSTTNLTGTLTKNSAVVTGLSSTSALAVGEVVTGTNIPANTTILSVDSTTQVTLSANASGGGSTALSFLPYVTLSAAATAGGQQSVTFLSYITLNQNASTNFSEALTFPAYITLSAAATSTGASSLTFLPQLILTGTLASGSPTVSGLSSTDGLVVGEEVTGNGIPANTTITAINAGLSQVTLSHQATSNGAQTLTFLSYLILSTPATQGGSQTLSLLPYVTLSQAATQSGSQTLTLPSEMILTGTLESGSTTVSLASTTGLSVGEEVSGTGIAVGTTISSIDVSNSQVTLNQAATASGSQNLAFSPPQMILSQPATASGLETLTFPPTLTLSLPATASGTQALTFLSQVTVAGTLASGSDVVTGLSSTSGLAVGESVTGTGIPANTTIVSVDTSTQVTLNATATASASENLTFTSSAGASIEAMLLDKGTSSSNVGAFVLGATFGPDGTVVQGAGLFASGGSVTVNADTFDTSSTGRIVSYGGATIDVENDSPDYLILGPVTIPDLAGGVVLFTGKAGQSSATGAGMTIDAVGASQTPSITIDNAYPNNVGTPPGGGQYGPALFVTAPIENLGGLLQITNVYGSWGQAAQIDCQQVNIDVPNGVAVIVEPPGTPYFAGGNPYSEWETAINWPGGNPTGAGYPSTYSADQAIAYVANAEYNSGGTYTNASGLTGYLIGTAGESSSANVVTYLQSYVFFGDGLPYTGIGDDSPGTASTQSSEIGAGSGNYRIGSGGPNNSDGFFPLIPVVPVSEATPSSESVSQQYEAATLSGSQNSSAIFGGQVAIKADYIDLDGPITVGPPNNWALDLPASLSAPYDQATQTEGILTYDLQEYMSEIQTNPQANPLFDIPVSDLGALPSGDSQITAQYNAQTNQIIVNNITASAGGANIYLDGQIISTNLYGELHVNGGLGQVNVTNETGIPLTVQNVNAGSTLPGSATVSQVDIKDLSSPGSGQGTQTLYVYQAGQGISTFTGAYTDTFNTLTGTLTSGSSVVTGVSNTTGLGVGQHVLGAGIPAGATIQAIDPADSQITLTSAATASGLQVLAETSASDGGFSAVAGTSTDFTPEAGLRWEWMETASLSRYNGSSPTGIPLNQDWTWSEPVGVANDPWQYESQSGDLSPIVNYASVPQGWTTLDSGDENTVFQENISASSYYFQEYVHYHGASNVGDTGHYGFKMTSGPDSSDSQTYGLWIFNYEYSATLTLTMSVKADNPIAVDFFGAATGSINITSDAHVSLDGTITNPSGTTTVSAQGGVSVAPGVTINTSNLTLNDSDGIGSPTQPFLVTLPPSGVLNIQGGSLGVYIQINSSALVDQVSSGDATDGYGDVVINATGALEPDPGLPAGTENIIGNNITLTSSTGGVGSQAAPLVIAAGSAPPASGTQGGVVNITAFDDIGIEQVGGDLLVGKIASTANGNVYLDVPDGQVLNAHGQTAAQALSQTQIQQIAQNLQLTALTGAQQSENQTVSAYESSVDGNYQQYWQLLQNGTVQGGTFTLNESAIPGFAARTASALGLNAYANGSDSTIRFNSMPNLSTGQPLEYTTVGAPIGGLANGTTYYAIAGPFDSYVDPTDSTIHIKTGPTMSTGQALEYTSTGTAIGGLTSGTTYYAIASSFQSYVDGTDSTIHFNTSPNLTTGQAIVYNSTGTAIGGLVSGNTYYVIVQSPTVIQLAATQADATQATPVPIVLDPTQGSGTQTLGNFSMAIVQPVSAMLSGSRIQLAASLGDAQAGRFITLDPTQGSGTQTLGGLSVALVQPPATTLSGSIIQLAASLGDAQAGRFITLDPTQSSGTQILGNYSVVSAGQEETYASGLYTQTVAFFVTNLGPTWPTLPDFQTFNAQFQYSIPDFEALVDSDYQLYWQLIDNGSVQDGTFTLNPSAVPAFTSQAAAALDIANPTAAQVEAYASTLYDQTVTFFVNNLGASWMSLSEFQTFVPQFQYSVTNFEPVVATNYQQYWQLLQDGSVSGGVYTLAVESAYAAQAANSLNIDVSSVTPAQVDAYATNLYQETVTFFQENLGPTWMSQPEFQTYNSNYQFTVAEFQNLINVNYQQYWVLVANGSVNSGTFTLNPSSVPTFTSQAAAALGIMNPTPQQVEAYASTLYQQIVTFFATNLGSSWMSLPEFAAFSAQFQYVVTAAQIIPALTQNAVWTEEQLTAAVDQIALNPNAPVGVGIPNVVGNVVTIDAQSGIGTTAAPVQINLTDLVSGNLTPKQKAELAVATAPGDVLYIGQDPQGNTYTFAYGQQPPQVTEITGIDVVQTSPLFVSAATAFNANVGGVLYVQSSTQNLILGSIQAGMSVELAAAGSILSAGTATPQISTPGDLTLLAGSGDLGTSTSPLVVQIGGTLVSAHAGGDINLDQVAGQGPANGNLIIEQIVAGGSATITADGSIENGNMLTGGTPTATQWNVSAPSVKLVAGAAGGPDGSIGSPSEPLVVIPALNTTSLSLTAMALNGLFIDSLGTLNSLNASTATGNATVQVLTGDANLALISDPFGLVTLTALGSILDATSGMDTDIVATSVILTATSGTIGLVSAPVRIITSDEGPGTVTAHAHGIVNLDQVSGDMTVVTVISDTSDVVLSALGSILSDNGMGVTTSNVDGVNLTLTAVAGSIGTPSANLFIQTSYSGILTGELTAVGQTGVYLTQVSGGLIVAQAVATTGNLEITVDNTSPTGEGLELISGGTISAPDTSQSNGNVLLRVGGSVFIAAGSTFSAGQSVTINGNYVNAVPPVGIRFDIDTAIVAPIVTLMGNDQPDTFNIQATASNSTMTIDAGTGVNTFNLGSNEPLQGGIVDNLKGAEILMGSGADTLNVDDTGSTISKTGTLTSSTLTGLNMGPDGITFSGLAFVNIDLGSGGNTFTIASTIAGQTFVNSGTGNDTVNVQTTSGPTTVNTGGGTNTVNVGSLSPAVGGIVDGIQGALTVDGSGADTMNVDDTGSTIAKSGTLTKATLTGLNMGPLGITYSGLATARISLGSGGNTFLIETTHTGQTILNTGTGTNTIDVQTISGPTNVNGQGASDTINVSSTAPTSGGVVNLIGAVLSVDGGSGVNTVNVDDTGSTVAKSGTLTANALSGLEMGGVLSYQNLTNLNISLGSGGNTFSVVATSAVTNTVIKTGTGQDQVSVLGIAGPLNLDAQAGPNVVYLGSTALNNGGTLQTISAPLTINGSGADTLNVDDSGDAQARTGTLTATGFTGLGLSPSGVDYSGMSAVNFSLGKGSYDFTIAGTIPGTTSVDTGTGSGIFNVQAISGPTTINSTFAPNTINVGSHTPAPGGTLAGIAALLTVQGGQYFDVVNVDDSGDPANESAQLTGSALTGLGMADGIAMSLVSALTVNLGSGTNTFLVEGTPLGQTTVNGGSGATTVNIQAIAGPATFNMGSGDNTIDVGSLAPASGGTLAGIAAALSLSGGTGSTSLNLDDSGDMAARTGILAATSLKGLGMLKGITESGMSSVDLALGSGTVNLTVAGTGARERRSPPSTATIRLTSRRPRVRSRSPPARVTAHSMSAARCPRWAAPWAASSAPSLSTPAPGRIL